MKSENIKENQIVKILIYILKYPSCRKSNIYQSFRINFNTLNVYLNEMRLRRLIYFPVNTKKILHPISYSITLDGVNYLIKNNINIKYWSDKL